MVNSLGTFNTVLNTTVCALKKPTVGVPILLRLSMRLRIVGRSHTRWGRIRGGNYAVVVGAEAHGGHLMLWQVWCLRDPRT